MSTKDVEDALNGATDSSGRQQIVDEAAGLPEENFETRIDEFIKKLTAIGITWTKTFLKAAVRRRRKEFRDEEQAQRRAAERQILGTERDPAKNYSIKDGGLIRTMGNEAEGFDLRLTNFDVQITADITQDNGVEITHLFEITATVNQQTRKFPIKAAEFASLRWVAENLGSNSIIYVNAYADDHVRVAIQAVSTNKVERTEYTHTGWREINGAWVYLHGDGAIGAKGPVENVHVALPRELAAFQLRLLSTDPREALKASLKFLDLGPDRITIPAYGTVPRAILGGADFSLLGLGTSGVFKTEISALLQQHFGAGFTSRNLPTSFASTANFNEALAFSCKDAIMVVDDFHPPASGSERERMLRDATRLFRAQGNQAGRGRMASDRSLKSAEWPRGLIDATGEDQLPGHSLNSRLLILEILKGDIDKAKLTACQHDAAAGLYAQATAAFIKWLAADFAKIQDWFHEEVSCLQSTFSHHHPRAADIRAQLTAAYAIFTEFLSDIGFFTTEAEQLKFVQRIRNALKAAADAQQNFAGASANTKKFSNSNSGWAPAASTICWRLAARTTPSSSVPSSTGRKRAGSRPYGKRTATPRVHTSGEFTIGWR
jgi:hypothetical protein